MENIYTLDAIYLCVSTPIVLGSLSLGSTGQREIWECRKCKIKLFWNIFVCHSFVPVYFYLVAQFWTGIQSPKKNDVYPKNLVFLELHLSLTPKHLGRKMNALTSPFLVFVSFRCWFKTLIFFHLEKYTRLMQFFSFPKLYSICSNWSFSHKCFYFMYTPIYTVSELLEKSDR